MNIIIDDKYNLCEQGFLVGKGVEIPLTSNFSNKTVAIPKRKGVWDFGTELGPMPFKIPLICTVQDVHERRWKMDELIDVLTDDFGVPKKVKFQFSSVKEWHVYLKLTSKVVPNKFYSSADLMLELVDNDSVWLSDARANDILWGSTIIDFTSDYLLGNTGSLTEFVLDGSKYYEVENIGRPVQPILTIKGSGKNVKFNLGRTSIEFGDMSNDTIKVDFKKYVAYKNGREYNMYIDDCYLMKGNNRLYFYGTDLKLTVTLEFNYER